MPNRPASLRVRSPLPTAVLVTVLAAGLAACTGPDPAPAPSGSASAPSASAVPEPAAPVETVVATLPEGRGTVDVAVRSLTLDDNGTTMTLRVDFTPHLMDPEDSMTLSMINDYFFVFPELLDRQHLKRYSVIEGEGPQDWLTNKDTRTSDGEPLASWFVYAAPEDDIETVDLTMDSWSLEIPDVPVTA